MLCHKLYVDEAVAAVVVVIAIVIAIAVDHQLHVVIFLPTNVLIESLPT